MKYTNKHSLPDVIFDVVTKKRYDNKGTLSATTLIQSPKISLLTKRHWDELEQDISDNIWMLFGSAVHNIFEKDVKEGETEKRLYTELKGKKISGMFDLLHNDILTDYKVPSVWSIIFNNNKWTEQLNIYKYLCEMNGIKVKKMQVIAILRDWQKSRAEKDADYPQLPIVVKEIFPYENTEEFVTRLVERYNEADKLADDDIPVCSEKDRWTTENVYAVYKNKNKTATKLCKTMEEADKFIVNMKKQYKDDFRIELRKGIDKRCEKYCGVNKFCNYYKGLNK